MASRSLPSSESNSRAMSGIELIERFSQPFEEEDDAQNDSEESVLKDPFEMAELYQQITSQPEGEPSHDDPNRPHQGRYEPSHPDYRLSRDDLRDLAESTLIKLDEGSYVPPGSNEAYDLTLKIIYTTENTTYYAPDDDDMTNWSNANLGINSDRTVSGTKIAIREYSTLVGARRLHAWLDLHPEYENRTIGVLNFASAKKPGGGFINGSQAQEESIARASTLYPSLLTLAAAPFYKHYAENTNDPFYTHSMIYSPSVVLFRNDKGSWMKPIEVDVLTSAAVNAADVREQVQWEQEMRLLKQRMKAVDDEADMFDDLSDFDNADVLKDPGSEDGDEYEPRPTDTKGKGREINTEEDPETTPRANRKMESTFPTVVGSSSDSNNISSSHPSSGVATPAQKSESEPDIDPNDPLQDPFYLAEIQIDIQMHERIGRLLYLFHKRGVKHLILGSFGTGVFQNRIDLVAGIFYHLLVAPGAKFKNVFDTVVFAILGGYTVRVFRETFADASLEVLDREDEIVDEVGGEWVRVMVGDDETDVDMLDGSDEPSSTLI